MLSFGGLFDDLFRTSIFECIFVSTWLPFGTLLAPFWSLLLDFDAILVPFWTLLVPIMLQNRVFWLPISQITCRLPFAPPT